MPTTIDLPKAMYNLKRRLDRLQRRFATMYNRNYARDVRRQKDHSRQAARVRQWMSTLDQNKDSLSVFARALKKVQSGRLIVMLSYQQMELLKYILSRRGWYRPRFSVKFPKVRPESPAV